MTVIQLRMAMAAEDMTLDQLAELSGLAAATLSRIRTGAQSPRLSTMNKLKAVFVARGYKFSATDEHVCVCAPAEEANHE
jgi:transcriptional regulator with XRE-family HTH domain